MNGGDKLTAVKIWAMKIGFAVLFLAVFAIMLLLLSAAAFGIPAGLLVCFFGFAVKLFNAQFIVTSLTAELMLFGGLAAAFGSAFLGLLAVKAGFCVSRLFIRVKKKCDLLRGWKPL